MSTNIKWLKVLLRSTKKYNVYKLVYYGVSDCIESAILREKQIKAGSREKKVGLIESVNPHLKDLYWEL